MMFVLAVIHSQTSPAINNKTHIHSNYNGHRNHATPKKKASGAPWSPERRHLEVQIEDLKVKIDEDENALVSIKEENKVLKEELGNNKAKLLELLKQLRKKLEHSLKEKLSLEEHNEQLQVPHTLTHIYGNKLMCYVILYDGGACGSGLTVLTSWCQQSEVETLKIDVKDDQEEIAELNTITKKLDAEIKLMKKKHNDEITFFRKRLEEDEKVHSLTERQKQYVEVR